MNIGDSVSVLDFMHLLSLRLGAGRADDPVLTQQVPQDLILGLPVFYLRRRAWLVWV